MADKETQPVGAGAAGASLRALEQRDPAALLDQWRRGVRIGHVAHTRAATVFAGRNRLLGILATLAAAIVGTSLFSSLTGSPDRNVVTFAAVFSVVAGILTAMQTFLNYPELVTGHRAAANAYGGLRRRIEQLLVFGDATQLSAPMAEIAETWSKLEQDAVDVPEDIYDYATKWVAKREAAGDQGAG